MFKFQNDKPIYLQIVDDILTKIFREEIILGDKLPSVRELAISYTVNPNTIQKVISELVNQNIVEIERGRGTFLTSDIDFINQLKTKVIKEEVHIFMNKLTNMGLKKNEILNEIMGSDLNDKNQ